MINIKWFGKNIKKAQNENIKTTYKLVTEKGNGQFIWNGKVYQSDIVRACMRPKVKAIGKLIGKHLRESIINDKRDLKINPDVYMRFLLEEPNALMSGQKLQEKLAAQLILNNNAYALITRDENGYANSIYPLTGALGVEAIYNNQGHLFLKFTMQNGKWFTFDYDDIIHLRQDFCENDLFGDSIQSSLTNLMTVIDTTDKGIVNAIKNSAVIQWLLKYTTQLRPEDLKANAEKFVEDYLSTTNGIGVAATDAKAEVQRVESKDYVPNAAQMDRTTERIYTAFNTNKKIVQSSYTEDEWNAYYEAEIEPVVIDLSAEYTRKLFSRRERGFGNRIVFEASNLATASMSTKLGLMAMVDRGAMTPNEWRAVHNLAPLEGGDEPIRRLDTALVNGGD